MKIEFFLLLQDLNSPSQGNSCYFPGNTLLPVCSSRNLHVFSFELTTSPFQTIVVILLLKPGHCKEGRGRRRPSGASRGGDFSSPELRPGGFTAECPHTAEGWLPFCSLNASQYFHLLPVAVSFCSKVLLDYQPD